MNDQTGLVLAREQLRTELDTQAVQATQDSSLSSRETKRKT